MIKDALKEHEYDPMTDEQIISIANSKEPIKWSFIKKPPNIVLDFTK